MTYYDCTEKTMEELIRTLHEHDMAYLEKRLRDEIEMDQYKKEEDK